MKLLKTLLLMLLPATSLAGVHVQQGDASVTIGSMTLTTSGQGIQFPDLTVQKTAASGGASSTTVTSGYGISVGGSSFTAIVTLLPNTTSYIQNVHQTPGNTAFSVTTGTVSGTLQMGSGQVLGTGAGQIYMNLGSTTTVTQTVGQVVIWADSVTDNPMFNSDSNSSYTFVGSSAGVVAGHMAGFSSQNGIVDIGTAFTQGAIASSAIFNQSFEQSGSTASPDFLYVFSSATLYAPVNILNTSSTTWTKVSSLTATGVYFDLTQSTMAISSMSITTGLWGAGLALCGDGTHALNYAPSTGFFGCQTLTGGGGGGGGSILAVGTGTVTGYTGTIVSSPTKMVLFDNSVFTSKGLDSANTTNFVSLGNILIPVNVQNSSVTISSNTQTGDLQNAQLNINNGGTGVGDWYSWLNFNNGLGFGYHAGNSPARFFWSNSGTILTGIEPGLGAFGTNQGLCTNANGDITTQCTRIAYAKSVTISSFTSVGNATINTVVSSFSVSNNAGESVTYNLNVGSMTGAGLTSCSGATSAVTWNSGTNLFGCNTIASGGSGGSFFNIDVATGGQYGFSSPPTSSQTIRAGIVFDSTTFNGKLTDATTIFMSLNSSSVTLQGVVTAGSLGALTANQSITLSGDASGTGTTAITVANASTQGNIHTLSGIVTHTSSTTFTGATLFTSTNTIVSSTTFAGNIAISSGLLLGSSAGNNGQGLASGGPGVAPGWTSFLTGNQNITASGDSSGSGTTAITLTAASTQNNIHTFGGPVTASSFTSYNAWIPTIQSSVTIQGGGGLVVTSTANLNGNTFVNRGLYLSSATSNGTGVGIINGNYTTGCQDNVIFASAPAPSGSTITLTAAANCPNQVIQITQVNQSTQPVIIQTTGADLIDASTGTLFLNAPGQTDELISGGSSGWWPHGQGIQPTPQRIFPVNYGQAVGATVATSSNIVICPFYTNVPVTVTGFTYDGATTAGGIIAFGVLDQKGNVISS